MFTVLLKITDKLQTTSSGVRMEGGGGGGGAFGADAPPPPPPPLHFISQTRAHN